jgi:hypothetical protein
MMHRALLNAAILLALLSLIPSALSQVPCSSLADTSSLGQRIANKYLSPEVCLFSTAGSEAQLFTASIFTVTALWSNGSAITGAHFQSRLFGATILTVHVTESGNTPGTYNFRFTPRDPGPHRLQVRLSWFTHRHENEETGPSAPYTYNALDYFDHVIYNHTLHIRPHSSLPVDEFQRDLPACRSGTEDGRWVRVAAGTGSCPSWACHRGGVDEAPEDFGNAAWLSDKFGFNKDYVWSPWNCSYRIMSAAAARKCFARKRLEFVGMVGDSLLRESLQNLFSLVVPSYTHARLKGVKTTFQLPLDHDGDAGAGGGASNRTLAVSYHYNHPEPGCKHIDSAHRERGTVLWNWPVIKTINSGWYMRELKPKLPGRIKKQFAEIMCGGAALPSVYLLHPRVQRSDLRGRPQDNPFNRISPMRQDALMAGIADTVRAVAGDAEVQLLDAMVLSESRWEASWDGIHYGVSVHTNDFHLYDPIATPINSTCSKGGASARASGGFDLCSLVQHTNYNFCIDDRMYWCNNVVGRVNQFDSFEGGVSKMATMIWLNLICSE